MDQHEFMQMLEKYADVIVKVGLNLQKDQQLSIYAELQDALLVRQITKSAYKAGAYHVDAVFIDQELIRLRFEHAKPESLTEVPKWIHSRDMANFKKGGADLTLWSLDPDLLDGFEPELVSNYRKARAKKFKPFLDLIDRNALTWSVVSTSTPVWAKKVFPDLSPEEAQTKLWYDILKSCRIDLDDPVSAWQEHFQNLAKRCEYLNNKQYIALHYQAPGTDLTVGLPENQCWLSGQMKSENGIDFVANLPTEEVFGMPHREKVSGTVKASMPLSLTGAMIEEFSLTFEKGKVVKASAKKGEEHLLKLLDTDKNARRLGEVALVPESSPISQLNHLFYNTLFDENAASHIALGSAYRPSIEGGEVMSKKEFEANGGNDSLIHTDFMIGSAEMDIDGFTKDNTREPIMRQGEWAFNV